VHANQRLSTNLVRKLALQERSESPRIRCLYHSRLFKRLKPMSLAHTIEELSQRIEQALPESLKQTKNEMDKTIRQAVMNAFQKMELVTRDEFDIQTQVLARTRAKLEALEQRVAALESSKSAT
jgi:BMFP domain-containing protein YqiC